MRRGLGHYVKGGYGGASTGARRFGGTARTAGTLFGALSSLGSAATADPTLELDRSALEGRTPREIIDAVVEAVRPIDGTQDAEAGREAIRNALSSELLSEFPDADLLNLTEEQRAFAVERYIALDVFYRVELDVGQAIQAKAPNARTAVSRLKEVKEYIRETIAAAFRRVRAGTSVLKVKQVRQMAQRCIREAFDVFEDYIK